MRVLSLGHILFALAIAGLGVISLTTGHFASVWQPVPAWLPAREVFAYANGILMLALGLGLLAKRTLGLAALVLTGYLLLWFFLLHGLKLASAPWVADTWSGFGENGALIVGGLMLIAACAGQNFRSLPPFITATAGIKLARIIFACAVFLMSLDNLAYPKANANFPPHWIPHWYGWGYLVGSAYIATGLSILLRVCPRLATLAAAVMMSLFTLLCWVSFVVQTPASRMIWTGLLVSSAITGAGWLVAESYQNHAWFEFPWLSTKPLSGNEAGNSEGTP